MKIKYNVVTKIQCEFTLEKFTPQNWKKSIKVEEKNQLVGLPSKEDMSKDGG